MPSIPLLIKNISKTYPDIRFETGDDFHWSFEDNAITYQVDDLQAAAHILHELAHALLHHQNYTRDIELIGMERDAWTYASAQLGDSFNVTVDKETVQSALDSYRDWLHARSTCPNCTATGVETSKSHYHCLACEHDWRVNEARICSLRRYSI